MSLFNSLIELPEDPILGLAAAFKNDPRTTKVNLGIGAYKNADGNSEILECVQSAEKIIFEKKLDKDYLPIIGNPDYLLASQKLIFGEDSSLINENVITSAQTIGGTGALRIGAEFLVQNNISKHIYVSDPTWTNHQQIFSKAGMKVGNYVYYAEIQGVLNFEGMKLSLMQIPPKSIILLQPCCHNPTGICPSFAQWEELSEIIKRNQLIPFFDLAYQGFDQSLDEDAKVVRFFAKSGHEMLVANSYSKNFGLYGERMGTLSIISQYNASAIASHLKRIIRSSYSNPPLHGQRIITEILNSQPLKTLWINELKKMRERIQQMRKELLNRLKQTTQTDQFDFLQQQTGMFSFSKLNEKQVDRLKQEYGIYMPQNGRINVAGLNQNNLDYVIKSIMAVV